jgi:hypothetical protein
LSGHLPTLTQAILSPVENPQDGFRNIANISYEGFIMRHALIACALLAAPVVAQAAEGISYNFAELRYINADADAISADARGLQLRGSFGFLNNFFVAGRFAYLDSEDFPVGMSTGSVEYMEGTVGIGGHFALTPVLDLVGSASYLYQDQEGQDAAKGGAFDVDSESGFEITSALRMLLTERIEVSGTYTYQDIDDSEESSFDLDGQYKFTPFFSGVVSVRYGADEDVHTVGGRFNF